MELYEQALKIAARAHHDQCRKHDDTPYIAHPIMVARILEQAGFEEIVIAAALVHDVLEDSAITEAELRTLLGDTVTDITEAVTEDKALAWEDRKEAYVKKVVAHGEGAWAVSVADKIHNARDFAAYHSTVGPDGWKIFNRGKEKKLWFEYLLLNELKTVWQHPLLAVYEKELQILESLIE